MKYTLGSVYKFLFQEKSEQMNFAEKLKGLESNDVNGRQVGRCLLDCLQLHILLLESEVHFVGVFFPSFSDFFPPHLYNRRTCAPVME
eukprot:m.78020 g.78020  ORF g.78020 m.78020 type:complete len:88 (-) comp14097_c2_seq3:1336-1599(-)